MLHTLPSSPVAPTTLSRTSLTQPHRPQQPRPEPSLVHTLLHQAPPLQYPISLGPPPLYFAANASHLMPSPYQLVTWFDHPRHSSDAIGSRLPSEETALCSLVGDLFPLIVQSTASIITDAKLMYEEASQLKNDAVESIKIVASFCAKEKVMVMYERSAKAGERQG